MAKPVYTLDKVLAKIAGGATFQPNATVDYGFFVPAGGSPYGATSALTTTQQSFVHEAMTAWDDVSNLRFSHTSSSAGADIKLYNVANNSFAGAQTGDQIMMSSTYSPTMNPSLGGYGFMVFIHEIGHALGLDHPGAYNGGSPTYAANAKFAQDSQQYTVMSYFSAANTGANHGGYFASTPLLYDIAAIQKLYGADMTTRTGDTTYGFNSTADRVAYDFTVNAHPIICIWDAGGTDTIDLSGFSATQLVDLRAGNFSNVGGLTKNLSIAYNCNVENAVGGSGNDTMIGNALNNVLTGGAGDDIFNGELGSDTLIGGSGNDTYYFGVGDVIQESSGGGTDTVVAAVSYVLGDNLENLLLTGTAAINGTGNALDNTLTGNRASNLLDGGLGNDTMIGGFGNDYYVVDAAGDVVRELAGQGMDSVLSSISYTLTDNVEHLTLTGTSVIDGTGNALNNILTGNAAANVLKGGAGADTLTGGAGNDVLNGQAGIDILTGGDGADRFCFDATSGGRDTIKDFRVSEGDTLDVHDLLIGFQADYLGSFVRMTASGASTLLSIDRDGGGSAYNFVQYALLNQASGLNVQTLFNNHILIA